MMQIFPFARWIGAAGALFLALTLALALGPSGAGAHGVQVASDPPPNAQLPDPPETIAITFSEPIEPSVSTIQLWDQSAQPVSLGQLQFPSDPKQMSVQVPDHLEPGLYTVVWRNLSTVDGHTWSGSFPFTVLGAGGEAPAVSGETLDVVEGLVETPSDNPSTLESAARWVVLLGSAVMLGGAAYVAFVVSPAARVLTSETRETLRGLSRTVLLVTVAIALFLVLEGSLLQLVVQADKLGGLGHVDNLLVDTRVGHYLLARQGLLVIALAALGLLWRSRGGLSEAAGLGLLLAASMGVLLTQSLVSHAAASDGSFWTTGVDVLHLLAASLWVGALIHIGLAMPRWLDELKGAPRTLFAAESFRRFSILAAVSVVVLFASGVLSALVQFTAWDELWSTSYGWSLVGKLGAIVPLLVVAGLNAFVLRPRVVDAVREVNGGGEPAAAPGTEAQPAVGRLQRMLANTVRAEAALAIVVLMAVAVLIQLQSPRTAAEAEEQSAVVPQPTPVAREQGPYQEDAEAGGLILLLRIEPGEVGENEFELGLGSEFGGIGEVLEARLEFDHENEEVGGSRLPLPLTGSARYAAEGSNLSLPGEWTVTANIRRRGEDDVRATFRVPVGELTGGAGPAEATEAETSESIWDWPFEGRRSAGAIAVLAVVGAGAAGWGAWRVARRT